MIVSLLLFQLMLELLSYLKVYCKVIYNYSLFIVDLFSNNIGIVMLLRIDLYLKFLNLN